MIPPKRRVNFRHYGSPPERKVVVTISWEQIVIWLLPVVLKAGLFFAILGVIAYFLSL